MASFGHLARCTDFDASRRAFPGRGAVEYVAWPLFAGFQMYEGHYLFGFTLATGWLLWIRFGSRFLGWSLQGLEWGAF